MQRELDSEGREVFEILLSYNLLFELAHKKAMRNYHEVLSLLRRNNHELKDDEEGLITGDEFLEALRMSYDLWTQEKFIPLNLSLFDIIVSHQSARDASPVNPPSASPKTSRKHLWSLGRSCVGSFSRGRTASSMVGR